MFESTELEMALRGASILIRGQAEQIKVLEQMAESKASILATVRLLGEKWKTEHNLAQEAWQTQGDMYEQGRADALGAAITQLEEALTAVKEEAKENG